MAALTLPLYILLPTFYAQALGLPLAAVGAALFAVRLVDAFSDPIIGYWSDRLSGPLGRRRSWFLASLPIASFASFMLLWPPSDAGSNHILVWGTVLSFGYTMGGLSYTAWGAELSTDYAGRSRVAAWREGFILLGTLAAITLPFSGFSLTDASSFHGLAALAVLVVVLLPVLGGLLVWWAPEPRNFSKSQLNLRSGLAAMARNKPFLRVLTAYLINGLANGFPATLALLFIEARLEAPDYQGAFLFLYFLAGLAGVPLFTHLAKLTSKHRAWCIAMLIGSAVFATAPFIAPGDLLSYGLLCLVTGICLGADLALPPAIQADVIDTDTATSGDQRSGAYFAAWSLATKLALALAAGLAFPILGAIGFNAETVSQSTEQSLFALAVLYAWVPVMFKLLAVALMWNFPIDATQQQKLREQIEAR